MFKKARYILLATLALWGGRFINAQALNYSQLSGQATVLGTNTSFYPYPTGTLVDDSGTVYFISGTTKVPFTSWQAFIGLGYKSTNIVSGDLTNYTPSASYTISTANTSHPWGSWLIYKGTVYYSTQSGLIGVPSAQAFTSNGGDWTYIVKANSYDIAALNTNANLQPLAVNDSRITGAPTYGSGNLPKTPPTATSTLNLLTVPSTGTSIRIGQLVSINGTVFLVAQNGLYGFPDINTFNSWSFSFSNVLPANTAETALPVLGVINARLQGCTDPISQLNGTCTASTAATASFTSNLSTVSSGGGVIFSWSVANVSSASAIGFEISCASGISMQDVTNNQAFTCGDIQRNTPASGSDTVQFTNTTGSAVPLIATLDYGSGSQKVINFTVNPVSTVGTPSITVTSPASGAQLVAGQTYSITWTSTGVQTVKLTQCATSNTLGYTCIAINGPSTNYNASLGSYSFFIDPNSPFVPGTGVKVRITDVASGVYGESAPFNIVAASTSTPTISYITPTSGTAGQTINIKIYGSGFLSVSSQSGDALPITSSLQLQTSRAVSDTEIDATYIIASNAPSATYQFAVGGSNAVPFTIVGASNTGAGHAIGTNVTDSNGVVYLIASNGQRRPYISSGAFLSYGFNSNSATVPANSTDLALPIGPYIFPADGTVACAGSATFNVNSCYLMSAGQKVSFSSTQVFTAWGLNPNQTTIADVSSAPNGGQITSASQAHLPGMLINKNGTVLLVGSDGNLEGIPDLATFNSWGWSFSNVIPANTGDAAATQTSTVIARIPGQLNPVTSSSVVPSAATTLTASLNPAFTALTIMQGTTGQRIGSYVVNNTSSQSVSLNSMFFGIDSATYGGQSLFQNIVVKLNGTQFGQVLGTPNASIGAYTFNAATPVTITPNTAFTVDIYADVPINSSAPGYINTVTLLENCSGTGISTAASGGCNVANGQSLTLAAPVSSTITLTPTFAVAISPLSQSVVGGTINQPIATYNVTASGGSATIQELDFTVVGSTSTPITTITVNGISAAMTGNTGKVSGLSLSVPANYSGVNIPVTVNYAQTGTNGVPAGQTFSLNLTGIKFLDSSGGVHTLSPNLASNQMTLVASN